MYHIYTPYKLYTRSIKLLKQAWLLLLKPVLPVSLSPLCSNELLAMEPPAQRPALAALRGTATGVVHGDALALEEEEVPQWVFSMAQVGRKVFFFFFFWLGGGKERLAIKDLEMTS